MKIYSNKADAYIKNLKMPTILVYGNDYGAVKEMEKKIISAVLPNADDFALTELSMDDIKDDEGRLLDELSSQSFFAEQKIIRISDAGDALVKALDNAYSSLSQDNFLLLTAGELPKTSKLRKFYEDSKELAAILCYKDDEYALKSHILASFREAGIDLDRDAAEYLTANLGEDKMMTNNEIAKIITYAGEAKKLEFEDVVSILADNSDISLADLAYTVSGRKPLQMEKCLARVFGQHIAPVAVLRMMLWHFQRLLQVKNHMESGQGMEAALKTLRPVVFFRQVAQFKADIAAWEMSKLVEALEIITIAELDAKKGVIEPEIACHNALLKLVRR